MFACRTVALLWLLPLIAHAVLGAETEDDLDEPKRVCPTCALKCSATGGPPAWGILPNGNCKVFVNDCIFRSENCRRQGKCQSAMLKSTQNVCQRSCPGFCRSKKWQPVCASYLDSAGEVKKTATFSSQCQLDRVACLRAKPYSFYTQGECAK